MKLVLAALLSAFGKTYTPDPALPLTLIFRVLLQRGYWLANGIVRLRQLAFVAPSVKLRGKSGIVLGRYATIEPHASLDGYARNRISIGPRSKIGAYTIVSCTSHLSQVGAGLRIGKDCGISEYCYIGAAGGVVLGDDVIIGQYVSFHSQNHNFADPKMKIREQGVTSRGIKVGDNVWIGAKVTILDGADIGDRSVIAAGAVVNCAFPPGSLIGGVPARVLGQI